MFHLKAFSLINALLQFNISLGSSETSDCGRRRSSSPHPTSNSFTIGALVQIIRVNTQSTNHTLSRESQWRDYLTSFQTWRHMGPLIVKLLNMLRCWMIIINPPQPIPVYWVIQVSLMMTWSMSLRVSRQTKKIVITPILNWLISKSQSSYPSSTYLNLRKWSNQWS